MEVSVETLAHGTKVCISRAHRFGTDAMLLSGFARPRRAETAVDLCSGCGIVALVWHDGGHRGPCTAVELDPAASALCAASLRENGISHITPLCADLRAFCRTGPEQGRYDLAACNPPYFTAGPRSPDPARAIARHADTCTLADAAQAAARALREGGRFALCQRPDQLAEVLCALRAVRLEPKRLAFVRQRAGRVPGLFLVEAQKGRRPGLRLEPDILIETGAARYGETKAAAPGQKQQ